MYIENTAEICTHVFIFVYMYMLMYVYIYIYIYIYTQVSTYIHMCAIVSPEVVLVSSPEELQKWIHIGPLQEPTFGVATPCKPIWLFSQRS